MADLPATDVTRPQLCDSDENNTHIIGIAGDFIYDSNHHERVELSPEALDGCCLGAASFKRVAYAVRFHPSDKLCRRLAVTVKEAMSRGEAVEEPLAKRQCLQPFQSAVVPSALVATAGEPHRAADPLPDGSRQCSQCWKTLPESAFSAKQKKRGGLRRCQACAQQCGPLEQGKKDSP